MKYSMLIPKKTTPSNVFWGVNITGFLNNETSLCPTVSALQTESQTPANDRIWVGLSASLLCHGLGEHTGNLSKALTLSNGVSVVVLECKENRPLNIRAMLRMNCEIMKPTKRSRMKGLVLSFSRRTSMTLGWLHIAARCKGVWPLEE